MLQENDRHFSKDIVDRITFLKNLSQEHLNIVSKLVHADEGKMFGVDLVVFAVLQRSLSLIDGFIALVEHRNVLCAAPLIRLQVDSVMRLYACWLVDDPHSIGLHLLDERPLRKLKSKDGHPLTDHYLHQKLSEIYPWASRVYQKLSGFIHLSSPHMHAPVKSVGDHIMNISIGLTHTGRTWAEAEIIEAIDAFTEATKCLLHLCYSWLFTKEKASSTRQTASPSS